MKYSDLISIKPDYNDVFDMIDEKAGYWKNFVTNKQFEENLLKIVKVFTSPVLTDHKSIWIQGTYGTGKSHSTSVVKHLLSDDYESVRDFVNNLMSSQLRSSIEQYRRTRKIFPIVMKGNHNITDSFDMKSVIQTEVKKAFEDNGYNLTVPCDFDAAKQLLSKPDLNSLCETLIREDLFEYVSTKEELFDKLDQQDLGILKKIKARLASNNISLTSTDIASWLKEVAAFMKREGIATDLVIIWDEFTSLLTISEKKAVYSIIQDIAELSKNENNAVYIFLITHVSLETTDFFRGMSAEEKDHVRDRFVVLPYAIQYDTTYTILYSAINKKDPAALDSLVDSRISRNMAVSECVEAVVRKSKDPAESKAKLLGLYPFHPYTAYISTFLARIIGSSERSVFNFLNDQSSGFVAFLENDVNTKYFLNIDSLWDFFLGKFSENPRCSEIISVYRKNVDKLKSEGDMPLAIFKSILLLNIMYDKATTGEDSDERTLTSPSRKNIEIAFSGTYQKDDVDACLDKMDSEGLIQRTPDDRYEFSISSTPKEKVEAKREALRNTYSSIAAIYKEFPIDRNNLEKILIENQAIKRPITVKTFGALSTSIEKSLTEIDQEISDKPGYIVVALFIRLGLPNDGKIVELSHQELSLKLREASNREKYKNVLFLELNNLEFDRNRRYQAFLTNMANMALANENGANQEATEEKRKAQGWLEHFRKEILDSGQVDFIFGGSSRQFAFIDVPAKINDHIVTTVYKYGLDNLKRIKNTIWKIKQRPQDKCIENMLVRSLDEIKKDSKYCDLIMDNAGVLVFNQDFSVNPTGTETPVTKLCLEVQKVMDAHQGESQVNVTDHFDWIFKPPYGYLLTESSMAAIALAFRPYINKVYVASTSAPLDSLQMKMFVTNLMSYFLIDNSKDYANLHIRFSSQEERELIQLLDSVFVLNKESNDGLMNIKWKLRDKIKTNNKAPLWVLKYMNANHALDSVIDKLFDFTQKQNEEINQSMVTSLLTGIKQQRYEISSVINEVKKEDCLKIYVENWLKNKSSSDLNSLEAIEYLRKNLAGELVFWNENSVEGVLNSFINYKRNPSPAPEVPSAPQPTENIAPSPLPESPAHVASDAEKLTKLLDNPSVSKGSLIKAIKAMTRKMPALSAEILAILQESNDGNDQG